MSNNNGKNVSKKDRAAFIAKMRQARETCFAILFEMTFTDDDYETILDNAVESRLITADEYTVKVLEYYSKNKEAVDGMIKANIKGWTFERLSRVPLSVMRLAICELNCCDTPESVVINEAIELTKKYAEPKESGFVNAVLGAVVRAGKNGKKESAGNEQN